MKRWATMKKKGKKDTKKERKTEKGILKRRARKRWATMKKGKERKEREKIRWNEEGRDDRREKKIVNAKEMK